MLPLLGRPVTVCERVVPIEWSWRSFAPAVEPTLSQYSLAPMPGVQENVTVVEVKVDPLTGLVISAAGESSVCTAR